MLHHLSEQAHYDVLLLGDSGLRLAPDYLRHVVRMLAPEDTGLVICPYRGEVADTLRARLEALNWV